MKKFYDIAGRNGRVYGVWIEFNEGKIIDFNCTCIWGSWFRWAKKNKTNMCIHLKKAIKIYENET